jgi:hypothetical protein
MSAKSDGAAAGRAWAASADNKLQAARLRSWFQHHVELDIWEPAHVYASLLTNKLVVDNTGKSGDDELFLAAEESGYLADDFWEHLPGWPGGDPSEHWEFIEGFVRGAVGQ